MSAVGAARVRPPAVAGAFYPGRPDEVLAALDDAYRDARPAPAGVGTPKALVVPHAGYVYSGAIAASAYQLVGADADRVERVVLIGPSHRVPLRGLALSSADAFATPLGQVSMADDLRDRAMTHDAVAVNDGAHEWEHSLEVQLPFLQALLGNTPVLPMAVGHCTPATIADVLDLVWAEASTLLVVSTDLSHYDTYERATVRDARTADAVLALDVDAVGTDDACGAYPLCGLLEASRRRDLAIALLDLRNSGDTAGDRDRVVGYGAFAVT